MTNIAEQTLASIVTANSRTVPVLEKHNLDFCCKGKRTLALACQEKGITVSDVVAELEMSGSSETTMRMPFTSMNAEQLIGHILVHHHFYVKQSMPMIMNHLEKVASKHGDRFPYMTRIQKLFSEVQEEMTAHMQKEELILFPRIKEVETAYLKREQLEFPGNYISAPIQVMESEHDHAGNILYEIRELSNNYTPPAEACTTFKVALAELKEFEDNLHQHVHLENNLLFPLAEKMMKSQSN